jgi:hypothetical protein
MLALCFISLQGFQYNFSENVTGEKRQTRGSLGFHFHTIHRIEIHNEKAF